MAGLKDPITDAQRAAARALVEGEAPTHARIAACMGVNVTTVSHWASEGGWAGLDFRHPRVRRAQRGMVALARAARAGEDAPDAADDGDEAGRDAVVAAGLAASPDAEGEAALARLAELPMPERTARIGKILTRRVESVLEGIEAGRPVETRQVVALNALVQLAEKITAMTEEDRRKAAIRTDEEVGELFERVKRKILVQALHFCRQVFEWRFGLTREQIDELIPVDPDNPDVSSDDIPRRRLVILPPKDATPEVAPPPGPGGERR